jgi:hypothetical protein
VAVRFDHLDTTPGAEPRPSDRRRKRRVYTWRALTVESFLERHQKLTSKRHLTMRADERVVLLDEHRATLRTKHRRSLMGSARRRHSLDCIDG